VNLPETPAFTRHAAETAAFFLQERKKNRNRRVEVVLTQRFPRLRSGRAAPSKNP
jgi:hypothetical protein